MTEEKCLDFIATVTELLENGRETEMMDLILDEENEILVRKWNIELFELIGNRLANGSISPNSRTAWESVTGCLEFVTKTCNPKENLLSLIELLDHNESDEFFNFLVSQIKTSFIRSSLTRGNTLIWALNAIYAYILKIGPPPKETADLGSVEPEETAILANCPYLARLDECTQTALSFVDPFVSEATVCKKVSQRVKATQQNSLISFILKLMEFPVAHFPCMGTEGGSLKRVSNGAPKTSAAGFLHSEHRATIQLAVRYLTELCSDTIVGVVSMMNAGKLQPPSNSADTRHMHVNPVSLGLLAYHMFVEDIGTAKQSAVRSHTFTFELLLPFVTSLLKQPYRPHFMVKGALLAERLVVYLPGKNDDQKLTDGFKNEGMNEGGGGGAEGTPGKLWGRERLNEDGIQSFFLGLLTVMTTSDNRSSRSVAVRTLGETMDRFSVAAQIAIIRMVFSKLDSSGALNSSKERDPEWSVIASRSGVLGWMIDYYRRKLATEPIITNKVTACDYRNGQTSDLRSSIYWEYLPAMLELGAKLENGVETDLLDNFDLSMAALNLIRFVLIRYNQTERDEAGCVNRSMLKMIDNAFVQPLISAIEWSQAHYRLKLNGINQEQARVKQVHAKRSVKDFTGSQGDHPDVEKDESNDGALGAELNEENQLSDPEGSEHMILSALNTFDLMLSVTGRVVELLQNGLKAH